MIQNRPQVSVSKGVALLIASLSSFLTPFTGSSVNIALPMIGKELSLDAIELSWVATAYLLAAAIFLVPFGRLADIYGRKRNYLIGIIIDAVASIMCGLSSSGTWLIVFRGLQGLGGAMIFGTGVAILPSVYPPRERGRALGINTAAVYTGLSVGPLIGGFLTGHLGWRSIFFLNALIGVVIIVAAVWKLHGEWAEAKGEKFDFVGSMIYSLALVAIMLGFTVLPSLSGGWLILAGVVGIVVLIRWELAQSHPVLDVGFFVNNRVFAFSNLAALINYSATFAIGFLLSLYLQYIQGFSPQNAGLVLIAQPVMMVICSLIAGSLSDRLEPRILSSAGMALTTAGLVMLALLGNNSGLAFVLVSLIILGIGFGFFSSPNTLAVMSSVERKYYGVASGMLATMRLVGQTFSLGMALVLFAIFIGRVQITPEYYPLFLKSMRIAFIISAALCFIGIFASAVRGKTHNGE